MLISKKPAPTRPVIHLDEPEGNAFVLCAAAKNIAKQLDYSKDEIERLDAEMKSSDYIHLVAVLEMTFGHVIDIIAPKGLKKEIAAEVSRLEQIKTGELAVENWLSK